MFGGNTGSSHWAQPFISGKGEIKLFFEEEADLTCLIHEKKCDKTKKHVLNSLVHLVALISHFL